MEENVTVLPGQAEETLYSDVCQIIDGTRGRIATFLNTEVCMTNWYIGKRFKEDVLFNQRAEYGKQVIKNLSLRLIGRYGSGWSEKKLRHCIRSAETFFGARHCLLNAETIDLDPSEELSYFSAISQPFQGISKMCLKMANRTRMW